MAKRGGPQQALGKAGGALLLVVVIAFALFRQFSGSPPTHGSLPPASPSPSTSGRADSGRAESTPPRRTPESTRSLGDGGIPALFSKKQSDAWVEASGTVRRVLADDTDGEPHQRFIVRVTPDIDVLIAHNIDAAARVPISEGDEVSFRGEYEWTEKGGTVHFTHAPKFKRREAGGWIEHKGVRYE